jgi:hypothetical protein
VVQGKGRPKGPKGKQKGKWGVKYDPAMAKAPFYSTILTFSSYLGTRQDPLAFEYPSTAPAVLSAASATVSETQESTAISTLISTTRLGIQRSEGTVDTYVPGTLPERLYKRAQLQVEVDDDTDGCYRLTTQDAPITVDEMETILAVEEDGKAIDKMLSGRQ